jgi:hypothetical protein
MNTPICRLSRFFLQFRPGVLPRRIGFEIHRHPAAFGGGQGRGYFFSCTGKEITAQQGFIRRDCGEPQKLIDGRSRKLVFVLPKHFSSFARYSDRVQ